MVKARNELKQTNDKAWIILDCRWASRGFNSEQATVYCIDGRMDKVIYIVNILRSREEAPPNITPSFIIVHQKHDAKSFLMDEAYQTN